MEFIHEVGESVDLEIAVDLANYRSKNGLWGKQFIWQNVADMNLVV